MPIPPPHEPVISYEYPLNERVRTLLRLENLFDRFVHHATLDAAIEHHAALLTLFDVFEVVYRTELKSDLAQELERQRQALGVWRHNPAVSAEMLCRVERLVRLSEHPIGPGFVAAGDVRGHADAQRPA